jgi:hypothetical protein
LIHVCLFTFNSFRRVSGQDLGCFHKAIFLFFLLKVHYDQSFPQSAHFSNQAPQPPSKHDFAPSEGFINGTQAPRIVRPGSPISIIWRACHANQHPFADVSRRFWGVLCKIAQALF